MLPLEITHGHGQVPSLGRSETYMSSLAQLLLEDCGRLEDTSDVGLC